MKSQFKSKKENMHPFNVTQFNAQSVNVNDIVGERYEISTYKKIVTLTSFSLMK